MKVECGDCMHYRKRIKELEAENLERLKRSNDLISKQAKRIQELEQQLADAKSVWKDEQAENIRLKEALGIYKIQFNAAMRAKSLGLCKKVISHARKDVQKALEE